jgi:hypothetical protein
MRVIQWVGGILCLCAFGTVACSGDDNAVPIAPAGDGGRDSGANGEASTVNEGGSGDGSAGDASDGGSLPDAGDASLPDGGDASLSNASDGAPLLDAADGAPPSDASDGGGLSYGLFVGTDFVTAELSVVALHPDALAGRMSIPDEDSIPYASNGFGFVLERGLGKAIALDPAQPWTARTTIDVNDTADAGAYASNPQAIVVTTGTKAYVARYASNKILVVDLASGAPTSPGVPSSEGTGPANEIDLSAFVAPDDPDGLVDVVDGAYDPTSKRAYFLLQRINLLAPLGPAPDQVPPCITSHGEIVAVDVTTDAIVASTDAATGGVIPLLGDDPVALTPDFANGRILVAETGCYEAPEGGADASEPDAGPAPRLGRGVESVSLATGNATWLYQTSELDRLQGLVWVDGTHAFVNEGSSWFAWNPTQTTLGDAVPNFPMAPFYDGAGRIVGLSAAQPDAGSDAGVEWSVVAWSLATSQVQTIVANPFQTVVPLAPYGVSSVLLR